ncbi:hypothetical protein A1Q2_06816 [Trichosporon asahii var. asahii CBS 8904]|uniref:Spc7 kinetochore protein domain-containing protein n=1 Tax=Trichosporon asahii var. asahii (strain CBS 8904) TaxID=1220162 RepID=K1VDD9_TRIAC|nr:hypothetical protein A1Q2_06816 [Trichosporon asahii var. asahii CBS 8904]
MSLPRVSPRRRKSVGLSERNLNNFDDDNLTLPATLKPKKRGVSMGGDLTSSRSFDGLSEKQRMRRAASILKLANPDEDNTAAYAETIDFGSLSKSRQSLGVERRVSFAPTTHEGVMKPRRKSSMGMMMSRNKQQHESPARPSLPSMPRRRSSIPNVQPPAPQYFVGEGEGGGEESMELESDDSANSDEILAQISAVSPAKSSDMSDSEDEMSMDETVIGGGIVQWDEADTEEDSDMDISQSSAATDDEEKTMDFTVALGEVVPVKAPQNAKRNRQSIGYSHPLEPGMLPVRPGVSDGPDNSAEMEMEETAIYGGIYGGMHDDSTISSNDSAGAEHTVTYTLGRMDFTQAGGGIVGRESLASDASFVTAGGMDFTEVGGGIIGRESTINRADFSYTMGGGMDFTEAVGGIVDEQTMAGQTTTSYTTSGGMDFTIAGGGINYQSTEVYGRTMNIFAPQPQPQQTPAPIPPATPKSSSSTRARSAIPDAPGSTPAAPRNPFAPQPATTQKPTMKNIFAPGTPAQATPAKKSTRRMSTPRAPTPARPQVTATPAKPPTRSTATPAKSPAPPIGTPGFARPTASSVKKTGTPAKSPAPKATPKPQKRNVFAPSPEELNGPPTPRTTGMHTAASVAKKLDFTPSSTKGTPNTTPASRIPLAASVQTTPLTLSTPGKRKRDEEDEDEAEEEAPSRKQQAVEAPDADSARSSTSEGRDSTSTIPTPTPSVPASARASPAPAPAPSLSTTTAGHASRCMSVAPSPVPEVHVESPALGPEAANEGEEDMEIEESEEVEMEEEDEGEEAEVEDNDREMTPELKPEDEDRPLPTITPTRRRSSVPRPSLGTPMRMLTAETAGMTLHPFETSRERAAAAAQDDAAAKTESDDDNAASGPVSLSEFLETVGVRFLDDLNPHVHQPRRSSVAPRGTLSAGEDTLSSFTVANAETIYVNMYDYGIDRMSSELAKSQEEIASSTRVCDADNPAVMREYYDSPPEERALYESTLRNFKAKALLQAQGEWYSWRLDVIERILPDFTAIHTAMAEEVEQHAVNHEVADTLLPDLAERHASLTVELEENKKQVAEILESDPTELADLKAAVVEQGEEITRFESELAQKSAQLGELEKEVAELERQEQEHTAALAVAKGMCDEYTSSDIRRLQSELSAMQALHGWRIVKTQPFEAVYANELLLKLDGEPRLSLMADAEGATDCLLSLAQGALRELKPASLAATVRAAGQLWTAASRLRAELALLELYYPAAFEIAEGELQCKARLMLPSAKSRADLTFAIGPQTLRRWPEPEAFAVPVHAEVKYGRARGERLEEVAKETLASAVPHVPGVLLQAHPSVPSLP